VGHETVKGFILMSDLDARKRLVEQVPVSKVAELVKAGKDLQFVDVRRPAEHANGHAEGTINIPLDRLSREIDMLDPERPTYVICQSGYRSSLGTSILENAGFKQIYNVAGGTSAWTDAGLKTDVLATACAKS
jgi:rhodanese-related sulfurtransferase